MKTLSPFALLAVVLSSVGSPAFAAGVRVSDAWSRPVAKGLATGVAYMDLVDTARAPDRLLGASSPVARSVSLHRSSMQGGMMSMTPVPNGLSLPPGKAILLAPDGYHLMLEGLKAGLSAGQRYPLTLHFARAGALTVQVEVRAGAVGGAAMKMR